MTAINKVCVFCASSTKVPQQYYTDTAILGTQLAANNVSVVYGGGSVGLMGTLANAVLQHNGTLIGVIPRFMMELEWGNPNATQLIVTEDMAERKKKMIEGIDAVIALPGGTGTLEELSEVISMKKLGLFLKPIVLLNTNHFFDPLIDFIKRMIADNFIHPRHLDLITLVDNPAGVLDACIKSKPWTDDDIKLAALQTRIKR